MDRRNWGCLVIHLNGVPRDGIHLEKTEVFDENLVYEATTLENPFHESGEVTQSSFLPIPNPLQVKDRSQV